MSDRVAAQQMSTSPPLPPLPAFAAYIPVTDLLPASDPPRLPVTLRMKFFNIASKVFHKLALFTSLTSSVLSAPTSLLPKHFPLPGCQTLCHERPCLVLSYCWTCALALPAAWVAFPSPLCLINASYFSGLT